MNKAITIQLDAYDPADMLLEVMLRAETSVDDYETTEDDYNVFQVTQALSPLWKNATGALSVGPRQYAEFSKGIAKARMSLPGILQKTLNDFTVTLPNTPTGLIVADWLKLSNVEVAVVPSGCAPLGCLPGWGVGSGARDDD